MTIHNFRWCIFERKKIMELELKHLAPYLPYGLKMIFEGKGGHVITLKGITDQGSYGVTITGGEGSMWLNGGGFKPILRPMSDLIKPVLNKGLYKIPMAALKNGGTDLNAVRVFDGDYSCIDNEEHQTIYSPSDMSFYQRYMGETRMCRGQYEKFQKLFEWHFDVFGLIPAGLAIDINTVY